MAQKNISIIKISPSDPDDYVIYDEQARNLAETAQSTADTAKSTADTAKSTADSKIKTVSLSSSYEDSTKTLTLNITTSNN